MHYAIVILTIWLVPFFIFAAPPVSGDDLFKNATNSYVQISPNGNLLSYLEVTDSERYLNFFNTDTQNLQASIKIGFRSQLRNYYWLKSDTLIIDIVRDSQGSLVIAVIDGENVQLKALEFYGKIISEMPSKPDKLLFSHHKTYRYKDLLEISVDDLINGNLDNTQETEFGVDGINRYGFDENADLLLLSKYDFEEETLYYYYQKLGTQKATQFIELQKIDYYFEVIHFFDKNRIAVLTNKDNDKIVLQEFFVDSQSLGNIIYGHEKYDLVRAAFNSKNELVAAGYFEHGIYQRTYFQNEVSEFAQRLKKTFPDKGVFFTDVSENNNKVVIKVSGATDPGTYYLYSVDDDVAHILMGRHPQLIDGQLYKNEKFLVEVDDGIEIEAYLTHPKTDQKSTLLVVPHGGPIGVRETDSFSREVQFYASRGFTVLRVNFRGSSGFGKTFQNQGVGQFGKLIEQDIMAAVNHVRADYNFKNVCAMGASYGGYSSTMLAIKHPDLIKCVIASFGVFDLPLLFNESNIKMQENHLEAISEIVGEYSQDLRDVSPLYLASQLTAGLYFD